MKAKTNTKTPISAAVDKFAGKIVVITNMTGNHSTSKLLQKLIFFSLLTDKYRAT